MSHNNDDDHSDSEYHDTYEDNLAANREVFITFHVHMPEKLDKPMHPLVVGNIKELGCWKQPVVKLHQIDANSTYWVSEPVKIYLREGKLQYKYAVHRPSENQGYFSRARNYVLGDQTIIMEGNSEKDNRELTYSENQYDVWKTNNNEKLYSPKLNEDFRFVTVIYESVTLENFKEKVMEFQTLLKFHKEPTVRAIDINSILNYFSNASNNYQKILTCVMLAYHIETVQKRTNTHIKLQENFPSAKFLQVLQEVQTDSFLPSNAKRPFTFVTSALVRHNSSKRDSFDWMKIFSVAPHLDSNYTFLSQIKKHEYKNKNDIQNFYNLLQKNVKPYVDKINNPLNYRKVIKTIITISFFGMDSCDFLINKIIGKNVDPEIIDFLRDDYISKNVDSDNPCELEEHFKSLNKELCDVCSPAFRNKFIKLICDDRSKWNSKYLDSLYRLFPQLFITEPEILHILELFSKSKSIDLLQVFPKWLEFVLNSRDNKQLLPKNILPLCVTWYTTIISTTQKEKNNIIIFMYQQLSAISFVFKKRSDIYKQQLAKIIETRIANISTQCLLQSTSSVGNFNLEYYILNDFIKIIKEKLNPHISTTDDVLIKTIVQICDSSVQPLNVPNRLCEIMICYILDVVRNKAITSGELNISNDERQLSLLKASKFWSFLLNVTGKVNELQEHPQMKYARSQIIQLVETIKNKSIKMGLLESLTELMNNELINYFNSGVGFDDEITGGMLDFLREKSQEHSEIAKHLFSFYYKWCNNTDDFHYYLDDLTKKMESLKDVSLDEFISQDYWLPHKMIIEISQKIYQYKDSQTFANMVKNNVKDEDLQLSVLNVTNIFTETVIEQYQKTCYSYKNWQNINCSEARVFWKDIAKEQVRHELEIMAGDTSLYQQRQRQDNLIVSIEYLALIPSYVTHLNCLKQVLTRFEVTDADKGWVTELLKDLENDDMKLDMLPDIFRKLNSHFNELNERTWSVIKELNFADEFIKYLLKNLIGRDLTNLINAVDDQSDTKLLQENTVAALIEVNKALNPLNENAARLSTTSFLKCLSEVSQKSSSLAEKISSCGSHNLALQNMHRNIEKRGEVTKERIKNAATIGLYKFEHNELSNSCELTLKYDTTQNQNNDAPRVAESYNIAELHDLCGRALLIGKSRASTDHSDDDDGTEDISVLMNQFIMQVDLAQQVATVASRLIQYGHFLYQKVHEEAHGTLDLQQLLDKLTNDMEKWEKIVDQAQNEHYYLTFFSARHILAFYDYFRSIDHAHNDENDNFHASNKEICQNLVRFVNDKAELPQLPNWTGKWPNVQSEVDFLPTLRKIGATLHNIFTDIPQRIRPIPDKVEPVIADTVFKGKIFVADCHSRSLVPNVILSLFTNHRSFPEPWQILICRSTTTAEEISLFIKRSFIAAKNGYHDYLFCIANVEFLDFELQYNLVKTIRIFQKEEPNYLLALVCTREKAMNHHILDQFSENIHPTNGLDSESMEILYSVICDNAMCVTSNMSGQGKTEWIKESSFRLGKAPRTLLIGDNVNFGTLVQQLANCKLSAFESLHLDITLVTYPHEINFFLFELLTLGVVSNEFDIVYLSQTLIFIEIASTIEQYLFNSLSLTKYIRRQHIEWSLENFIVPRHLNSPIQIVSYYMDVHSRGSLDDTNIRFIGSEAVKEPLPAERCRELLERYFFSDQLDNVFSYRFLEIFINVLANQLVRLSASSFFQVEQLRLMTQETNVRSSLFEILVSCSKEFATRAIKAKDMQKENIKKENNQDVDTARLGDIIQWDDSNHLVVVFLSQMPDSICALYREKSKVPGNVENLLKSQNAELQDYFKMNPEMLLEQLERLARRKMHKLKDLPEYALTIENLLKMAMILLRSRANIPVVCSGEAGCGKTSLISFLSMVMEVNFRALNLHAGVHENDILDFMEKVTTLALKGETWVFFDEINTCDHIGMLGSLISHRLLNGKKIHPNIRLFAACNPYRLRTKAQSNVGLSAKLYEEKGRLVYQVHPMPDQILDYVWDYGHLKADDERNYVEIMVKTQLNHPFFAELLCASQAFIRKVEEPFSVSLRDVKRAIKLFKFFKKNFSKFNYAQNNSKIISPETRSLVLALGLCYLFRLHDQSERKEYRKEMIGIIEKYEKIDESQYRNQRSKDFFENIISHEQENYFIHMRCPEGTAANEALLENLLVMIVCIQTRIPVFIIGAPGSSKSLAVRIISMNLRGADSDDSYFRTLPQVYMIRYQGSSSSTSEGISKVFQTAQNYQQTSSKENPVTAVVLLDEVGLAETSPYNPLKVLHALLEPPLGSQSSEPAVPVIGISNWRLDNSKSSRALLVQRPLFAENDLIDTAKRLLRNNIKGIYNIDDFLRKLAKSYLESSGLLFFSKEYKKHEEQARALARNFGGADNMDELCNTYFKPVLKQSHRYRFEYVPIPVQELIDANFEEKNARNLMLIGNSNSIVTLQMYRLRRKGNEPVVIIGSQFADDIDGGDYSYAILNRIM
ncbi:17412_t:CDS:2, partial [Cetraspora pellucida]